MHSILLAGNMTKFCFSKQVITFGGTKVLGSTCYVRDVPPSVTKLDSQALKCVFFGYYRIQKECRCYSTEFEKHLV